VRSYIQHQGAKSPDALVELVSTSQQRFVDAVDEVPDDIAGKKPAADEWSLRELIRHVIDAESGVAMLVERLARGQQPEQRGGAGRMVEDDDRPFASYIDEVRSLNERMLGAIRRLPPEPNLTMTAKHPFFGELNCKEWAAFQRVHDEDHVQHAAKILAAVRG
jgi:hypothetical protein